MMNRREWFTSSAALASVATAARGQSGKGKKPIAISSPNGLAAVAKAVEVMKAGGDTLDAVIAGVNILELDPNDTSVGYGGLPNEEGLVELNACVMHGAYAARRFGGGDPWDQDALENRQAGAGAYHAS